MVSKSVLVILLIRFYFYGKVDKNIIRQDIALKYCILLRELNLVTPSNHTRQKELYMRFKQTLTVDFLADTKCIRCCR